MCLYPGPILGVVGDSRNWASPPSLPTNGTQPPSGGCEARTGGGQVGLGAPGVWEVGIQEPVPGSWVRGSTMCDLRLQALARAPVFHWTLLNRKKC